MAKERKIGEKKLECQMCGGKVTIPADVMESEIVSCDDCGLEYEISGVNNGTLQLKPADSIKEDWGE
jgi:alpha-aminoadipate carrier protein LysW